MVTLTTNYIPVGIGYDSDGNAKGLVELSSINAPFAGAVSAYYITSTSVSSAYTILSSDRLIYANPTSSITIELPLASISTNRVIDIHNRSFNQVTIDGNGSETINGELTQILASKYDSLTLHCDGIEWSII